MGIHKVAKKANVEIQKRPDGSETEVVLMVSSADGKDLTANQILEAVAEALLMFWDNCPIEPRDLGEFDA